MPNSVARVGNNLPNGEFNPTIWTKKLNNKYYAQVCLMDICNSMWEGEIKTQGSSVMIRTIPTVIVEDHKVNDDINYQDVNDEKIELLINQAKRFGIKNDDIDAVQQDIDVLNQLTRDAGFRMKIAIEKQVFGSVYGEAANTLVTADSIALAKSNVIDWIVDAEVIMEENNLPESERWLVIPPKIAGLVQKSDLKNASLTGDSKSIIRSGMTNGRLGQVGGITLYVSNNLAKTGTTYQCIAGHKSAITYASQIVKVEKLRLQTKFGDAVRGLNLFGYKVVLPSGLISMPAILAV